MAADSLSVHSATILGLISFMYSMKALRGFLMWSLSCIEEEDEPPWLFRPRDLVGVGGLRGPMGGQTPDPGERRAAAAETSGPPPFPVAAAAAAAAAAEGRGGKRSPYLERGLEYEKIKA